MTLKDAYNHWKLAPRNMAMVRKYSVAVQNVLMKLYADKDLSVFTEEFVRELFAKCDEPKEFKSQAASVLGWLLSWGGDHGYCERPTFDFSIGNQEEPKNDDDMSGNRGRAPRPVAQIDPNTLEVVKLWSGITTAASQLGIKNIDRAIQRCGLAGGFFWCDEKDIDSFQPGTRAERKLEKARKSLTKVKGQLKEARASRLRDGEPAPQLQEEVPTRVAEQSQPAMYDVTGLERYTDEQLKEALYARGWRGRLTKVSVMDL